MTETKKASSGSTLKRMLSYFRKHISGMTIAVLCTMIANISSLFIPKFAGSAIDSIGVLGDFTDSGLFRLCCLMLGAVFLNSGFAYLSQIVLVKISSKITSEMRTQLFDHLSSLPVSFFDHTAFGDIISRMSYDIDTINTSLSSDLTQIATSMITVIGSLIMMFAISGKLCVVFLITTPLIIFITKHRATVVRPLFHKRSVKLGELNGFAEEMLSGHKTIKAYGQEDSILQRFDTRNQEAVDTYFEADYQGSIVGPTVTFVNNLSLAIISCVGGLMYLNHGITVGAISAFILYSKKFSGPISGMAEIMADMQSSISAARRVFALLDEEPEKKDDKGATVLDRVKGDVVFENVKFGYDANKEILHGLNIHAESGKMIAIVGPTGAGKTTIINLLMRFYDVNSGSIRIDGKDIVHCTRDSLRRQFSMVLQDTWLFEGSILENVAYGRENVTRDEVIRACKMADIHDFVMNLKDGYDTVLTDDGINISKGQKQLLTIARAFLQDASILILDEATSSVDSEIERRIQNAMLALCKGKTTFIIAHRLSTIQEADTILVLNHGAVIEQGNHEELLAQKGFYSSLYMSQWSDSK